MIRYVRLFLPFAIILLIAGQLSPLLAGLCNAQTIPWNEALEGARILGNFRRLLDPENLMAGDVFLIGTSRTTSAFAPPVLETALTQAFPEEGPWSVINLQTYGRFAQRAEDVLERTNPDASLIVFEFSPFLFTYESEELVEPSDFSRYRRTIEVEELRLQGTLDSILGLENRIFVDPAYLYSYVLPKLRKLESCQGLYYILRLKGPGESAAQALRNEIPVYLSIIPDKAALTALRDVMGDSAVPAEAPSEPEFNEEAWNAFERMVQRYSATRRLVVVRPPVSAETYEREAMIFADAIARTETLLEQYDVPLINMNPNTYESMDGSHLVWFESVAASEQLAQEIIAVWQPQ